MNTYFGDCSRWMDAHRKASVILLVASFLIVLFPRFDRNDIAVIRPLVGLNAGEVSLDIKNYIHFAEYFKGKMPLDSVAVPYCYRPIVPLLASLLPMDSLLGLIFVSIASLILSVVCVYDILRMRGHEFGWRIVGSFFYVLSFPVFYYGSSGYIDASALLVICAVVWATNAKRYLLLPLILIAGAGIKEVAIIALPYAFLSQYQNWKISSTKSYSFIISSFTATALFLAAYFWCRSTFETPGGQFWTPTVSALLENVARPKTYLSFILSFGIVGLLGSFQIVRGLKTYIGRAVGPWRYIVESPDAPYFVGFLGSLVLCLYALFAAYSDGRFIWTAYPFLIPLAIRFLSERTERTNLAVSTR